jgi:hypothetical protein
VGSGRPEDAGAAVNFLMIGGKPSLCRGIWNFRVIGHAVERFFERGGEDLDGALYEANRRVIKGRLYRLPESGEVLVGAPPGAFIGRANPGGFKGAGIVVARTWLHFDMLHDDQERRLAELEAARVAA